jgi:hypothetical protein
MAEDLKARRRGERPGMTETEGRNRRIRALEGGAPGEVVPAVSRKHSVLAAKKRLLLKLVRLLCSQVKALVPLMHPSHLATKKLCIAVVK